MVISEVSELRRWRKRLGLSQSQIADSAGVSQSLIARIENEDVDPRLSTFNKIKEVVKKESSKETQKSTDLMSSPVIYAKPEEKLSEVSKKFVKNDISQIPVIKEGKQKGSLTESVILNKTSEKLEDGNLNDMEAEKVMAAPFPMLSADSNLNDILSLLKRNKAILISIEGDIEGIITRSDVIELI